MECASANFNMVSKDWSWWEGFKPRENSTDAILTLSFLLLTLFWYIFLIKKSRVKAPPLPPGPRGLPIIGNLPFLEPDLHRCFAKLAQTFGPILKLRLGSKLCIVLSSPSMAKEALKDQDIIFANRDVPAVMLAAPQTYGSLDIVWTPYGPQWRMVRKICVKEIMSNRGLDSWYTLRRREVHKTMQNVYAKKGTPINVADEMFLTVLNVITGMLWGGTLMTQEQSHVVAEFRPLVEEIMSLTAKINVSDLFPLLAHFDLQGLKRRMTQLVSSLDQIFNTIIEKKLMTYRNGEKEDRKMKCSDFLDCLLNFDNGGSETALTNNHIKALFMDIVLAGTDTTSTTVEWTMAELLEHPEIMRKAQEELEQVVGINSIVEESHLAKLHYLDAIIKEVLRLHTPVPLLVPHCPSKTCTMGGYTVPKGARILVNAWAIHTDPQAWENPLEFQPERFLSADRKWDFNGNNFHYIPFGSGRRICAGLPMAEKITMYVLASLLHSFEWGLPEGTKLDFAEKLGSVLKKATPLLAVPKPRLPNPRFYD